VDGRIGTIPSGSRADSFEEAFPLKGDHRNLPGHADAVFQKPGHDHQGVHGVGNEESGWPVGSREKFSKPPVNGINLAVVFDHRARGVRFRKGLKKTPFLGGLARASKGPPDENDFLVPQTEKPGGRMVGDRPEVVVDKGKMDGWVGVSHNDRRDPLLLEPALNWRHQAINAESGESTIAAEIQILRIAECVLVGAPLEVLTEVSLNLKKASPFKQTFLAAFSNGYMHYGPPVGDYAKGGYEVIECFLAPEWQEVFEQTVGELLSRIEGQKNQ